jgi:hypothetical protein
MDTNEVGPLQNSHIIPRFILLKSKDLGQALHYSSDDKSYEISQEDWTEYLFCKPCEHRFKQYEDFIQDVLYLRRRTRNLGRWNNTTVVHASNDALALALLTILWRAATTSNQFFHRIQLPEILISEIRAWILMKAAPRWRHVVGIQIKEIKGNDDLTLTPLIEPFMRREKDEDPIEYVFSYGGFLVTYSLPHKAGSIFGKSKALRPDSQLVRIPIVQVEQVKEFREIMSEMIESPPHPEMQAKMYAFHKRAKSRRPKNRK